MVKLPFDVAEHQKLESLLATILRISTYVIIRIFQILRNLGFRRQATSGDITSKGEGTVSFVAIGGCHCPFGIAYANSKLLQERSLESIGGWRRGGW